MTTENLYIKSFHDDYWSIDQLSEIADNARLKSIFDKVEMKAQKGERRIWVGTLDNVSTSVQRKLSQIGFLVEVTADEVFLIIPESTEEEAFSIPAEDYDRSVYVDMGFDERFNYRDHDTPVECYKFTTTLKRVMIIPMSEVDSYEEAVEIANEDFIQHAIDKLS